MDMSKNIDYIKRILVIGNKLRRCLDASFTRIGLTGAQGAILYFIYTQKGQHDIFQRDIEMEFGIRRSSVTSVLQGLERGGFILRENVEEDARLKKLTLTAKAIKKSEKIAEFIDKINNLMIRNLKKQDVDCLDRLLEKIEGNLP
jgi:DNA-binding MarR family transcriptional regulator